MKAGVFIVAAALAGAPVGAAFAQQEGGQQGQQPQQQQTRPAPGAAGQPGQQPGQQPGEQTRQQQAGQQQRSGMVASDAITGVNVKDQQGENVGSINRLIVDRQSGEIAHVIVSSGGFLGIGRDYVQLSWDQVNLVHEDGNIVARVNRATIDAAPTVDRDRFDQAWDRGRTDTGVGTTGTARDADRDRATGVGTTGVDRETGVGTTGAARPGERDTAQARGTAQTAAGANLIAEDRLTGSQVRDAQRNDIGRVERLMINPQDGRVGYMVVGMGGFLGVGRDYVLVPFDNVQVNMEDRDLYVMLDRQVIDAAPRVWTDDRDGILDRDRGVTDRDRDDRDRGVTGGDRGTTPGQR
jgi:sporulation protein YlmC with PRC-barrel domain